MWALSDQASQGQASPACTITDLPLEVLDVLSAFLSTRDR